MKRLNRNDLCWCGSEKKYKKCHQEFDDKLFFLKNEGYPIPNRKLIKSEADIAGIRKSSALTRRLLDELNDVIKVGMTTNDINNWVHEETIKAGATPAPLNYKGFPKSICTSLNEVVCHGIPSDRVLKDGDILNVDITCIIDGYYGDSCRMYPVGTISDEAQRLIDVTKQCLDSSIDIIKPFDSLNVVGDEITRIAHENGYSVVDMFGGHGIGNAFHEEPFVYHCSMREKQMICAPGMVFTIEPMINEGVKGCKILSDDWTAITKDKKLSAQWEHTILITDTGAEVLT